MIETNNMIEYMTDFITNNTTSMLTKLNARISHIDKTRPLQPAHPFTGVCIMG